jgi:hypothetical protein
VAEAFAWGQKFQLGYGKHPPLAGWIAGAWFRFFPVTDWATYALAMTTLGVGLVICWLIALRVVDTRRAFFVVVMLALYPIFNFKGFKYNPDLLQLVTLPLVVLAYLNAFEKRTWASGIWLGLAGAAALMTKYWVLTMIGAIGLAALIHPERLTDWGISLFFLTPLALVAIPALRLRAMAVVRLTLIWLVISLAVLAAAPQIATAVMEDNPNNGNAYGARSQLARELTEAWHTRFGTRWAVVAGTTEVGEPMTFYSADHPAPFTPGEVWTSGLTSLEEARRLGFIGICDTTDNRLPACEAWMKENAPGAEQVVMTTQRFFRGHPGPSTAWKIYIQPPAK